LLLAKKPINVLNVLSEGKVEHIANCSKRIYENDAYGFEVQQALLSISKLIPR
jgi:hypothetical protein